MNSWDEIKKWARKSPWRSIVLFEIVGALPMSAIYLILFQMDGTLTARLALRVVVYSAIACAVTAITSWYLYKHLFRVFRPNDKR